MALFERKRPRRRTISAADSSLTASGERITRETVDSIRRLKQQWQTRSFVYYDILGEINYAAQFYARGLSQLTLYAAETDENGDIVETKDPDAIAALDRIQDPGGGRTGLLASYGRLMFLTGECYLFVSEDPDTEIEQWEMLSTDELRLEGNVYQRIGAPQLPAEGYREIGEDDWYTVTGKDAVAYRLWQRHPRFSQLADSTMRGVLELCEELVLMTATVRARTRSRMAGAGVLFIDDRISSAPPVPVGDEDPQEDIFMSDLTKTMTTPISDEGSASSVVPMIARVPVPDGMSLKDMVWHLQIVDPTQLYPETGLRYECIQRIAIGLDLPPEVLTGIGAANHWSAWQIDEQTWKGHLQPKAQQLVDDLTSAYLRPALKANGKKDWAKFSVAYDASQIINHPDRAKDARENHDRLVISDESLRDATGFDEADAPSDAERISRIGIMVKDGSLAVTGVPRAIDSPTGASGLGAPGKTPAPITSEDVLKEAPDPGEAQDRATDTPTPEGVLGAGNGNGRINVARVLGASDLAVLRCRESAGNRIKSLAKRDPDLAALLEGVPAGKAAATLGRERVKSLRAPTDAELVSGARGLILDTLRIYHLDEGVAEKITENIERHAVRTLYDETPAPLSASFSNYIGGLTSKA